mgnify:FL=1
MGRKINNANTPSGVFQCMTPDLFGPLGAVPLRVSATVAPLTVKLSGGDGHPASVVIEAASEEAPVTIDGYTCDDDAYSRPLAGGPRVITAPCELALSLSPSGWTVEE